VSVLIVSPFTQDHVFLTAVLDRMAVPVRTARTCAQAIQALRSQPATLVVYEEDLPDGNWRRILEETDQWMSPPLLIVISRFADEQLWAEVLNLGGYDVLVKPFDEEETERVLEAACRRARQATVSAA
jgi:DNA-binding response OmpR family regulator